jgi:hypothetical protein
MSAQLMLGQREAEVISINPVVEEDCYKPPLVNGEQRDRIFQAHRLGLWLSRRAGGRWLPSWLAAAGHDCAVSSQYLTSVRCGAWRATRRLANTQLKLGVNRKPTRVGLGSPAPN